MCYRICTSDKRKWVGSWLPTRGLRRLDTPLLTGTDPGDLAENSVHDEFPRSQMLSLVSGTWNYGFREEMDPLGLFSLKNCVDGKMDSAAPHLGGNE